MESVSEVNVGRIRATRESQDSAVSIGDVTVTIGEMVEHSDSNYVPLTNENEVQSGSQRRRKKVYPVAMAPTRSSQRLTERASEDTALKRTRVVYSPDKFSRDRGSNSNGTC